MESVLPSDIQSIFERLWAAEIKARREAVAEYVSAMKSEFAARGILQSSIAVEKFKLRFREELRGRCSRLLNTAKRVLDETQSKLSSAAAEGLREQLGQLVDNQTIELGTTLANELSSLSLGGGDLAVQDEAVSAKNTLLAEFDLFVKARANTGLQPVSPALSTDRPNVDRQGEEVRSPERDPITKLWPRGVLETEFPERIREARTSGNPLSVVMVDIDQFKGVNDTHGHLVGDAVLAAVSQRVQTVVDGKGEAYRFGGEEFTLLLPNHTVSEATAVAERARRDVEASPVTGVSVTASFGVSTFPDHGTTQEGLIQSADTALYDAKNRGRNLVRAFGEAAPTQTGTREPERRIPEPGGLSEAEKEDLRSQHFRGYEIRCPRDDAILDVTERQRVDRKTPDLTVWCKLCGLMATI